MGFEELLAKKLGPMAAWIDRAPRPEAPRFDPARLYYRRAAGLEVHVRPEESWSNAWVTPSGGERASHPLAELGPLLGLTRWTSAEALAQRGLPAERLWRAVQADLLFFAEEDPGVALTGQAGVLALGRNLARRASAWPTPAVETALEIAPMPFMPRAGVLAGAELVGARFASLERGHEVLGATITGGPRTGRVLRVLLPLLDGGARPAEILAAAGPLAEDAERMLHLLDLLTLLEARDAPPEPHQAWRRPRGPQVTWLGHGAVLAQSGGTSALVDPLFFAPSEPEAPWAGPPKPDPRALPAVDVVLITHGDNDHLNPASLIHLPRRTPVLIPRLPDRLPPYQVDLRGVLGVLGFEDVRELGPWEETRVGAFVITACPFEGESWGLPLAKCTYALASRDLSLFFAADSGPMDQVYARLAQRRVDLAFMGVSGNAETYGAPAGLGYGNFYAEWIPPVRKNQWVQHCAGPREAAHSVGLFAPRYAFGYAAGGAPFIRTEYSDRGDHAALAALLAQRPGLATRPVALPLGRPVLLSELDALPATSLP